MYHGSPFLSLSLSPGRPCPERPLNRSTLGKIRADWCSASRNMLALSDIITYLAVMNSKHRKTLAAVFTDPVSGTIEWAAVESLLLAAGARLIEGRGSRVRFEKDGEVATFHRPHPAKEAKRYQVRDARDFLERIGVRP